MNVEETLKGEKKFRHNNIYKSQSNFAHCFLAFLTHTKDYQLVLKEHRCQFIGYLIGSSHEKPVVIGYRLKEIHIVRS